MHNVEPWSESSNILANLTWKISFLNNFFSFFFFSHMTSEFGSIPHIEESRCVISWQKSAVWTLVIFPAGLGGFCAPPSPGGGLLKKRVLVWIDFWHSCQRHPLFGPPRHIPRWRVCSCIASFHIFCMLHPAEKQLFIMHDVLYSVADRWLQQAESPARFSLCCQPLHYSPWRCCFVMDSQKQKEVVLGSEPVGTPWRNAGPEGQVSCREAVLKKRVKGIKHMHKTCLFYSRMYVVMDQVPSVKDVQSFPWGLGTGSKKDKGRRPAFTKYLACVWAFSGFYCT